MKKDRIIKNLIEMIKIYSPSKKEGKFAEYLTKKLEDMGAQIYLDKGYENYGGNSPTIIAKIKGNLKGEGITLSAHLDVIEPCENINPILDKNVLKTDGTTTLGGDDKAGIASILETIEVLKENKISHEDIFIVLTPGEELGMLGAKNITWDLIPNDMIPAKNMIVVDNAGRAGLIAHTAPSKYDLIMKFKGKKAHAGIEPENGINAINLAALAISKMKMGRIDNLTTSNIGFIYSEFPTNVVADECLVKAEVRSHSEEKILEVIEEYKKCCDEAKNIFNGEYSLEYSCDYPVLKPKDNLEFANKFAKIYESIGVETELKVIGGGSDSNIFAKKGYNSIIIGVGMYNVHTVNEILELEELYKTTEALIKFISK